MFHGIVLNHQLLATEPKSQLTAIIGIKHFNTVNNADIRCET